jgi:hypothetical protein
MDDDADDITESEARCICHQRLTWSIRWISSVPLFFSPPTNHPLEMIEGGSNAELDLKLTNRVVRQADQSSSSSFKSTLQISSSICQNGQWLFVDLNAD